MKKSTVTPYKLMLRIPPEVYDHAKWMSEEQLRSLNSEIIYQLKQAYGLGGKREVSV
ncbi:Arc family DNA-binding protein [Shewanella chilikensis]|jgi:hypothetical protein|uniref:Arc family DNA-binding protein n=1 Tax=Shewanella TaxID=22 RepID=UPI001AAD942B|nr:MULTISPECIES: Arc family DNA-binding protein [Shewanella]MBO2552582.1 Arc family DNA-binding protein [Shewanella algae]MCL1161506.1 Arc family DNA-binding protein [Shewanella chilikensis]